MELNAEQRTARVRGELTKRERLPAELREAISDFYRTRYGVAVPAARIVVTSGASGALNPLIT